MTTNTDCSSEPMRALRSDEIEAVAGGADPTFSFSLGFISVDYWGGKGGVGNGPLGDGVELTLVMRAQCMNGMRRQVF